MCDGKEKPQQRSLKKQSSWRHQLSWRKKVRTVSEPLQIPFDEAAAEVFNNLFACSREKRELSQNHVRQLLLWDWIQGQDGESILGIALAKAMLSRVYREVIFTFVDALIPVWQGNDFAQPGETVFAHLPQFCLSFPRLAGCLVNGCQALEIPLDLTELLAATDLSGGLYEGSTFEDCLQRSFLRARARWLSGQIRRQDPEDVVQFAASELLRNFTAEHYRLQPDLHTCWLYLFLFVQSVYRDHVARDELDGFPSLATEKEVSSVLVLFKTTMAQRYEEMRHYFLRSESYWRWTEALESIDTVDWDRYAGPSDGSDKARMVAIITNAFSKTDGKERAEGQERHAFAAVGKCLTCSSFA